MPASCFLVSITKHDGKPLGIDVDKRDGLKIASMKEGLVKEWNDAHPTMQILPGDRIIEVNKASGTGDELLAAIGSSDVLELLVERPEVEGSGGHADASRDDRKEEIKREVHDFMSKACLAGFDMECVDIETSECSPCLFRMSMEELPLEEMMSTGKADIKKFSLIGESPLVASVKDLALKDVVSVSKGAEGNIVTVDTGDIAGRLHLRLPDEASRDKFFMCMKIMCMYAEQRG